MKLGSPASARLVLARAAETPAANSAPEVTNPRRETSDTLAACAGFSDQSQFTHHFKRLVTVTPGQFRKPARIA
jgi:AraC-like DNA-binding protein